MSALSRERVGGVRDPERVPSITSLMDSRELNRILSSGSAPAPSVGIGVQANKSMTCSHFALGQCACWPPCRRLGLAKVTPKQQMEIRCRVSGQACRKRVKVGFPRADVKRPAVPTPEISALFDAAVRSRPCTRYLGQSLRTERAVARIGSRMHIEVQVEVVPFGHFRANSIAVLPRTEPVREDKAAEPVVLPPTTVADFCIQSAPEQIFQD